MTTENTETVENDGEDLATQLEKLKAKNSELIGKNKSLAQKYSTFEGIDLEEYQALKQAQAAALEKKEKDKGNFEALLTKTKAEHAAAMEAERKRAAGLAEKFTKAKYTAEVTSAIASENGIPKLLHPIIERRVKSVLDDEGEVVLEIYDEDGQLMEGKTVKDLIAELKADGDYGSAFKSTAASGGGASSGTKVGLSGEDNPYMPGSINYTKQGILENTDMAKALKLKAAAKAASAK